MPSRRFSLRTAVRRSLPALALLLAASGAQANLITVDTTVDEFDSNTSSDQGCSLREAIYAANEDVAYGSCTAGGGPSDLIFLPAGTYPLVLGATPIPDNEGDLYIDSAIAIVGTGGTPTIDASNLGDRIFNVDPFAGSFELTNVRLVGGEASSGGSTLERFDGGAIRTRNSVNLKLTNVTIEDCMARNGGAISLEEFVAQASEPIFDFEGVTFRNNTATGGALYLKPRNVSQIQCEDCIFDGNQTSEIGAGGAISATSNVRLHLIDSVLTGNESRFDGAIRSIGAWTTLTNVVIEGNTSNGEPSGYSGVTSSVLFVHDSTLRDPVQIADLTDMQVTDSRFEMAVQPVIDADGGFITLLRSVVADNGCIDCEEFAIRAEGTGIELRETLLEGNDGGLECIDCDLTIARSSFVGNSRRSATGDGAALRVRGTSAELTIENSTFSGNVASLDPLGIEYGTGAGIHLSEGTSFVLNNVTVADNRGGGLHSGGAVAAGLSNTLLADNIDGTTISSFGSDCTGVVASQGWNLIGLDPGCFSSPTVGDQVGVLGTPVLAQLDALTTVDGLPVHGLLPGSPARDAGNSTAPDGTAPRCETGDQVGTDRPQDGGNGAVCDIGAIEGSVVGDDVLFDDGFESGDLTGWSTSSP